MISTTINFSTPYEIEDLKKVVSNINRDFTNTEIKYTQVEEFNELETLTYEVLLKTNTTDKSTNEVVISYKEFLEILNEAKNVQMVKCTELTDLSKILQETNPKRMVVKYYIHPDYDISNLTEITNIIQSSSKVERVIFGVGNDLTMELDEICIVVVLVS